MTQQELEALLNEEVRVSLLNKATRLTGSKADAEDLVQVTFIKAYTNADKFDGDHFVAWISTIMRNEFINSWNRVKKYEGPLISEETDLVDLYDKHSGELALSAEEVSLWDTFSDEVKNAWRHLTNEQALTIYYVDILSYSYKECAEKLNCEIGTVMSRLGRGREVLRKNLVRA